MITRPLLRENLRRCFPRARSWWIPAALLALTPKCIACVLGYASLGAMFGLGGPELCGASGGAAGHWKAWLLLLGAAAGISMFTISRIAARRGTSARRRQLDCSTRPQRCDHTIPAHK